MKKILKARRARAAQSRGRRTHARNRGRAGERIEARLDARDERRARRNHKLYQQLSAGAKAARDAGMTLQSAVELARAYTRSMASWANPPRR